MMWTDQSLITLKGQTFQSFQIQSMRVLSVEGLNDVAKSHGMQTALWSQVASQRISYLESNISE